MKLSRSAQPTYFLTSLSPLVNVVLLLMLFFLLGSSFVLQPGINIQLPTAQFHLTPVVDAQIVSILAGNPPRIYFQDQPISIDEFTHRLDTFQGTNRMVILRADKGINYETVIAIGSQVLEHGFNVVLATSPESTKPNTK